MHKKGILDIPCIGFHVWQAGLPSSEKEEVIASYAVHLGCRWIQPLPVSAQHHP